MVSPRCRVGVEKVFITAGWESVKKKKKKITTYSFAKTPLKAAQAPLAAARASQELLLVMIVDSFGLKLKTENRKLDKVERFYEVAKFC